MKNTKTTRTNNHVNHCPFKAVISTDGTTQFQALVCESKAYAVASDDDTAFFFRGTRYNTVAISHEKFKVCKSTFVFPKSSSKEILEAIKKASSPKKKTTDDTDDDEAKNVFLLRDNFMMSVKNHLLAYNELVLEHTLLSEELGRAAKYEQLVPVETRYDENSLSTETEKFNFEIEFIEEEIKDLENKLEYKKSELAQKKYELDEVEENILNSVNSQIANLEKQSQSIYFNTPIINEEVECMKVEQQNAAEIAAALEKLKELTGKDYAPVGTTTEIIVPKPKKEFVPEVPVYTDEAESEYRHLAAHLYRVRLHREQPNRNIFKEISDLSFEIKLSMHEFCEKVLNCQPQTFNRRHASQFKNFGLDIYKSKGGRGKKASKGGEQ